MTTKENDVKTSKEKEKKNEGYKYEIGAKLMCKWRDNQFRMCAHPSFENFRFIF
jgi:hypothetical protein